MPIIEPTQEDILSGTIVDPAYYRLQIKDIREKNSKAGDSIVYPVDAVIVCNADDGSTDFAGVPINGDAGSWMFSSKFMAPVFQFMDAMGTKAEAGVRVELANYAGKEIIAFVGTNTFEGRVSNRVEHKYRAVE